MWYYDKPKPSPKIKAVLDALKASSGVVMNRQSIAEAMGRGDIHHGSYHSRAVDTAVKRARKFAHSEGAQIRSVFGIGYVYVSREAVKDWR